MMFHGHARIKTSNNLNGQVCGSQGTETALVLTPATMKPSLSRCQCLYTTDLLGPKVVNPVSEVETHCTVHRTRSNLLSVDRSHLLLTFTRLLLFLALDDQLLHIRAREFSCTDPLLEKSIELSIRATSRLR